MLLVTVESNLPHYRVKPTIFLVENISKMDGIRPSSSQTYRLRRVRPTIFALMVSKGFAFHTRD